jgi:two-component system sensor histidine kinase RegB
MAQSAAMNATAAARRGFFHRARQLAETLAWLRLCAVSGQALTVAVVAFAFDMAIPLAPLAGGIAALALFALFAFWRLSRAWPVSLAEAFGHVAVDIIVLTWLLYFSGGATNPFVSLLVMPIALAAAALPLRYVAATAVLAAACYLLLIPWHVPLPPQHVAGTGDFNLHVAGMAINFVVTAAVLAFFIARLARALREREAEVQREHERALRDEGILAIATQAAGTAHELNTPLSTIRTLLAELRREQPPDSALAADLTLLSGQAERCRDILRELVAVGSRQLSGEPQRIALTAFVADCENQFRLLRPEVDLEVSLDAEIGSRIIEAEPNLQHALINLLSNAADASLANGASSIELGVSAHRDSVEFRVRDHGAGLGIGHGAGTAFKTSKRDGLGLGLALAHATAERLGGELIAQSLAEGGLLQRLRVPLAAADNRVP